MSGASPDRIALEFICTFGMPPVEHVELAARLGFRRIGFAPAPIVTLPGLHPAWDLRTDLALRRDTVRALADNGLSLSLGEGFLVMPGKAVEDLGADLDLAVELGAPLVNCCVLAPDMAFAVDQFGQFAAMAAERGLQVTVEFLAGMMAIGDLATAAALVREVANPAAGLLIDAMHLYRSGASHVDLAALEPGMVRYAQVCDVPMASTFENYGEEASYERGAPGEGELPLVDFVKALPAGVPIGLEAPMRARTLAGVGAFDRLAPALAATRALLVQAAG